MADGGHIEVAKAYVTIVPSLEGSQQTIATELGAITSPASKTVGEQSGQELGNALATGLQAASAVIAAAMAAVVGAAVATGKAFIDTANEVGQLGNEIDKNSQKMQMSISGYQTWDFILEHTGANIEGMKTAMKKLTVAAEEGNDAFTALGISQEELNNMSPEETWNATVEALQQVTDEGQRTALASELLGKGAVELAPLFNMTAEETEALKQQVVELGGIMSDDAVKAAAEYEDQMQNMNVALEGVRNNMMAKFLPGMSQVMQGLSMVFSGQGGIEEIREGLTSVIDNINELAPEFLEIASTIVLAILDGFAPMLPTAVQAIFSFLDQALLTIITLVPQLLPIITQLLGSLMSTVFTLLPMLTSSLLSLVTDLVTWLASGDNVKTFTKGIVQLVTGIVGQIATILPILLPAVMEIIKEVVTTLTSPECIEQLLGAVLLLVGAIAVALYNTIPVFIEYIGGVLSNLVSLITDFFNWTSPLVAQGIAFIVDTVKGWGESIKSFISGLVQGIYNTVKSWGESIANFYYNLVSSVYYTVTGWLSSIATAFVNGWNNISSWASAILTNITNFVTNIFNAFVNLPNEIVSIGSDMAQGLINGLDVDWVIDQVKKLGKKAINALKDTLGIASPSKVMKEIGGYMSEGLAEGWTEGMEDFEGDMLDAADNFTASMTADISATGTAGAAMVGDATTINGGAITMNIYGAEGQNVNELADAIAEKLEDMTARRGAVYA